MEYPDIADFMLPGEPHPVSEETVRLIYEAMEREAERIALEEATAVMKSKEIILNV